MTPAKRRHFAIVTPLDCDVFPDNLEGNRIRAWAERGHRVTLIQKKMNRAPGLWANLKNTLLFSFNVRKKGNVTIVTVDPWMNYYAGVRKGAEEAAGSEAAKKRGVTLKLIIIRLFSPVCVLRDLFVTPFLILTGMIWLGRDVDVLMGCGPWGGLAGLALRRIGKAKSMVWYDRDYEPGLIPDKFRQNYTLKAENFGMPRADMVIHVGRMLSERRHRETGVTGRITPSGADCEFYEPARRGREGIPHNLFYVGNVVGWSGLEHAVRAMPAILEKFPDARLIIAGDGFPLYVKTLGEVAEDLGVEDALEMLGCQPHDNLPELMAKAGIGICYAEPVDFRRYACPLKAAEYMAAGLPLIVTEDTEASTVVEDAGAGLGVPYNADAFGQAVIKMWSDPERWRAMSEAGVEASKEMDWGYIIDRELGWLEELI